MFAVSSNALLARPAAATRAQRAPAARRVVAARASADAETTGAKVRQAATVALLSATVAFGGRSSPSRASSTWYRRQQPGA